MILDLNAKRAARAAKRGEPMRMILGDETFDLVDELPLQIGELANENRIGDAFKIMLREPEADWERLMKCRPSFNDVLDVVEYFGTALGESARSIEPLETTGPPLSATSTASTEGNSLATVTAIDHLTPDESSASSGDSPENPPMSAS